MRSVTTIEPFSGRLAAGQLEISSTISLTIDVCYMEMVS